MTEGPKEGIYKPNMARICTLTNDLQAPLNGAVQRDGVMGAVVGLRKMVEIKGSPSLSFNWNLLSSFCELLHILFMEMAL